MSGPDLALLVGPAGEVEPHVIAGDLQEAGPGLSGLKLAGQTGQLCLPVHLGQAVVNQACEERLVLSLK